MLAQSSDKGDTIWQHDRTGLREAAFRLNRKRINQSMLAYAERMLPYISGRSAEEKRVHAFILFSGMAGVLVAARTVADPQGRERLLAAARSFYLQSFAPAKG